MAHCGKNLVPCPSELKCGCKTDSRTTAGHKNSRHDTKVAKGTKGPALGLTAFQKLRKREIVLEGTPLQRRKHHYISRTRSKRIGDRAVLWIVDAVESPQSTRVEPSIKSPICRKRLNGFRSLRQYCRHTFAMVKKSERVYGSAGRGLRTIQLEYTGAYRAHF